jgi:hypothetical protein
MNERIQELMGKTLDDKFSHTWDTMTHEGLLQFSEKFAELIVKECAQVCRDQPNIYAEKVARDNCAIAIEDHFGVEDFEE